MAKHAALRRHEPGAPRRTSFSDHIKVKSCAAKCMTCKAIVRFLPYNPVRNDDLSEAGDRRRAACQQTFDTLFAFIEEHRSHAAL